VVGARVDRDTEVLLRRVRAMNHIRGKLREYVEAAITAYPPVRTTKRLATLVDRKESAVRDVWSHRFRSKGGGRLKEFLFALLAYRAAAAARRGTSPQEVAEELGVGAATLARVTHRAFGVKPINLSRVSSLRALEAVTVVLAARR